VGRNEETGPAEKDWSIPAVDSQAFGASPFHRWDPRIKIVSLLFYTLCVSSLATMPWACAGLFTSLVAVGVARIPLRYPLRRLAAMGTFLTMFVVVMPLTAPVHSGDTTVTFEHMAWISLNLRGLLAALLICVKACTIALIVEPLLATAPFAATVQALARLRLPAVACQMLLLTHRYVFVFQDEASRMAKGMAARGFVKRTNLLTLRTVGHFLGILLVRSFERTQRIYDAMLSRGYDGSFPKSAEFQARRSDWVKGGGWVAWATALVVLDRLLPYQL
jgi:cobalt/nickel transport system permease protein